MEGKKISFAFMKTKKAEKPVVEEKRDFIECVEEKSIKVVGGEAIVDNTPLVIPMKPNTLMTNERLRQIAEKVESAIDEPEIKETPSEPMQIVPENETLEQMAARELLEDAKKTKIKVETKEFSVPLPAKPVSDSQKESTLDDYEAVPVQQFGMAMLRGMGWTSSTEQSQYKQPQLRPKGLGLGADKVVTDKQKKKLAKDSKGDELTIVKNSYVKITTGKYSGYYGKVVSLDEDNGRVMVDIPIKKETVNLSEFMMHPVTKSEYDKESKVINADTFEEYKKSEKLQQKSIKNEESSSSLNHRNTRINDSKYNDSRSERETEKPSNGRSQDRCRRKSSSSEERNRRRNDKKYSSDESLSSLSDTDKKRRKHKSKKRGSPESSGSYKESRKHKKSSEGKRDIDKKRKGKKKKRDRDRSPNYKKHRK